MSALREDGVGNEEPIKVLFTLHEGFHILDFTGPLSVLTAARHNPKDSSTEAFDITIAAGKQNVLSGQDVVVQSHISWKEAKERIDEFDVLIVPGGGTKDVLDNFAEPIPLIQAFVEHQQADTSRERTLMSVCTGSLLLARADALKGMSATTHHDYDIQLEKLCQTASAMEIDDRTDVLQGTRYVVNNARFDLTLPEESEPNTDTEDAAPKSPDTIRMKANPFVLSKAEYLSLRASKNTSNGQPGGFGARRGSNARKGSFSFKESNTRRESITRRQHLRLGGLRVITSAGVTAGMDAALYLVSAHVSVESAEEVAKGMEFEWQKGVVVNSVDV